MYLLRILSVYLHVLVMIKHFFLFLVGPLKVLKESPSFEALENKFYNLEPGGRYKPPDCISRNKVALIIPYRDREEHLRIFLHNMHPILQRQQLDYGIYVIEEVRYLLKMSDI